MKNIFKSLAVLAAILSFSACQKEIEGSKEETRVSHKVTFIAGTPDTKTTATIDKEHGVVDYEWTKADEQRFTLYEIKGGSELVPATETVATLDGDGKMSIIADFDGAATAGSSYIALFNTSVASAQTATSGVYDQESDVLISQVVSSEAIEDEELYLSFKREVAIAEATLKNLTKGAKVSEVVIESLDHTLLSADYNLTDKSFATTGSEKITISCEDIEVAGEQAKIRFVTLPLENASLKMSVTTVDGEGTKVAEYVKEFKNPITFVQGNLKSFGVALEEVQQKHTATISSFSAASGSINEDINYESFKGNASNAPVVNNECLRLYQNGAYVTVSGVKGVKIVSIAATMGATYESTTIGYALDDADAPTSGVSVAKNASFELSGINNQRVSLYCLGTDNKSRADIKSISVEYTKEAVELSSIALSGDYKTTFIQRETFSHDGLVVTATYSDGDTQDVTAGAEFSEPDMTTVGSKTVTVSYTLGDITKTATYDITVTAEEVESLALSGDYQTAFNAGDTFNHDNIVVTATYNNGRKADVTSDAAFSTPDMSLVGNQTITVSYGGKSTSYQITVNSSSTVFYESFDTNDGTGGNDDQWSGQIASNNISSDNENWTFVKGNGANKCAKFGAGSSLGSAQTPEISFSGSAVIKFKAAAWNTNNEETTLKLSATSGTLDAATVTLAKGAWTSYEVAISGVSSSTKIKFEGNSTSNSRFFLDEVKVEKKELLSIAVSGTPTKTSYYVGDALDPAGLVVTGTYAGGQIEQISNGITWTLTPETLSEGMTSCNVVAHVGGKDSPSYTVSGLSVSVPVTLVSVAVSGAPSKTTYNAGDAFDPAGLTVTGTYSDSHQETITEGITWSEPAALIAGQTSVDITATVNDITSEAYTVTGLTVNAAVTLQSITVSGEPNKKTYNAGDAFDPAGLTVTGRYSDGNDRAITEGITWSKPAALTAGQTSVTITATVNGITSAEYTVTGLTVTAASKTYTHIFTSGASGTMSKNVQSYTDSFTNNSDGITTTLTNFNNNNRGWNYVKCGSKNAASTGTIVTNSAITEAIKRVKLTIDATNTTNVTSVKLIISSNSTFTNNTEEYSFTNSNGEQVVTIPTPKANYYYKIEVVCSKSSNGIFQTSKIIYTTTSAD